MPTSDAYRWRPGNWTEHQSWAFMPNWFVPCSRRFVAVAASPLTAGPLSLLCGAVSFDNTWSACEQHEIKYREWRMNKDTYKCTSVFNVTCMSVCVCVYSMSNKGILTYSMVQSPSWETNCFAAIQEIPRISRISKVHYRTHKRPPPVSIRGQPSPVHIPTSHLLEIRPNIIHPSTPPNIIHPSTPRSPQWSPSLPFPHQDPIRPPLLTHTCHMPSPWLY